MSDDQYRIMYLTCYDDRVSFMAFTDQQQARRRIHRRWLSQVQPRWSDAKLNKGLTSGETRPRPCNCIAPNKQGRKCVYGEECRVPCVIYKIKCVGIARSPTLGIQATISRVEWQAIAWILVVCLIYCRTSGVLLVQGILSSISGYRIRTDPPMDHRLGVRTSGVWWSHLLFVPLMV